MMIKTSYGITLSEITGNTQISEVGLIFVIISFQRLQSNGQETINN